MKLRQFAILSLLSLVSIWYASAQSSRADSLDQQLIQTAGYGNTAAVLSLLQRGANIEAKDNFIGNTPLIEAAGDGNADTVKLLLDKGANIEAKNKSGETPLLRALGRINNADVVKLLIDRKANLEVANDEGRTPLILETSIGTPELDIVKLLLDQGAKVDATDGQGNTPLFWAVSSDNADLVKLLLDRGANIEARNKYYGDTPLMAAAGGGHADLVKLLLNRGANPEAKDDSGNTARDLAESRHRAEALQVLEEARLSLVKENPRTTLNAYIDSLAKVPSDDAIRNKIIELVTTLQPPPSIPDEARQHFMKGVVLMQVKNPSRADMEDAIKEFQQSELIAPWWGNAYYNLARAQEAGGFYDDAVSNLNFYLKTKPSDADAQDAQARIYAIQAEKQSAAQAKEQHERELAFKYVSGGVARVRVSDSPELWGIGHNYGGLYGYTLPDEDPYFANIFLMPDGRYLAITLAPVTNPRLHRPLRLYGRQYPYC